MPSALSRMQFLSCTEKIAGKVYAAPGTVIAVTLNGILLEPNKGYSCMGTMITLKIQTEMGDRVDALCIA